MYVMRVQLGNNAHRSGSTNLPVPLKTSKYVKKRLGANAVEEHELLDNASEVLSPLQATTYRALAARVNSLAQGRADTAFAANEL